MHGCIIAFLQDSRTCQMIRKRVKRYRLEFFSGEDE